MISCGCSQTPPWKVRQILDQRVHTYLPGNRLDYYRFLVLRVRASGPA